MSPPPDTFYNHWSIPSTAVMVVTYHHLPLPLCTLHHSHCHVRPSTTDIQIVLHCQPDILKHYLCHPAQFVIAIATADPPLPTTLDIRVILLFNYYLIWLKYKIRYSSIYYLVDYTTLKYYTNLFVFDPPIIQLAYLIYQWFNIISCPPNEK
jgi:hypothetical protein